MLEARNLHVRRNGDRPVLDGVDLDLAEGELVVLTGPSGGGKSTLLWTLARLLPCEAGSLRLRGTRSREIPVTSWRRHVALLVQEPTLLEGTVGENLRLPWTLAVRSHDGEGPPPDERLREELDRLGLADVDLARSSRELSVGQAARVGFARTILTRPDVVLLDEPGSALDRDAAELLARRVEAFAASGGAVLLVEHHRLARRATRRLRLEGGRLTEEGP
jgi:putative ABC transport system ATP-binding protein